MSEMLLLCHSTAVISADSEKGTSSTAWSRPKRETEVVLPAPVRHTNGT